MSLIEEALDKAEKEKTERAETVPSSFSSTKNSPPRINSRSPLRILVIVVSILCIAGSLGWLSYWWFQYKSQGHSNRIALNMKQPTPLPLPKGQPPSEAQSPTASVMKTAAVPSPSENPDMKHQQAPTKKVGNPPSPDNHDRVSPTSTHASVKASASVSTPKISHKKVTHQKESKRTRTLRARHSRHKVKKEKFLPRKRRVASSAGRVKKTGPARKSGSVEPLSILLAKKAINEGLTAYKQGNLQKAARALERSITYAEPTAGTLGFLGIIYLKLEAYDKAYTLLSRALAEDPLNSNFLDKMGITLMARGENTRAIPFFLRVIKSHPFRYSPHVNLGIAYWKSGNLTAAREQFLTAIKIRKDRPEAYYNLSGIYEAMGDYNRAIAPLKTFIDISRGIDESRLREAKTHLEALKIYIKEGRNK